jgi:hypothetical protein
MRISGVILITALFLVSGSLALFPFKSVAASNVPFGSSASVVISGAKSIAQPPIITNAGDDVYVSYAQATPKAGVQIYFQKITDNGTIVGPKVLISSGADNMTNNFQRIAASGSDVYLTWQYNTVFGESILFRASTDTGNTWGAIQNLSALTGREVLASCKTLCAYPTIAVNGTYVYVSWTQQAPSKGGQAIYFTTSNNFGATGSFNTPVDIAPLTNQAWHEQEMAAWGNDVAVFWDSGSVFFTVSHNNGASFTSHTNIDQNFSTSSKSKSREPHVSIYGKNVYAVWEDNSLGKYQAFIKSSINGGDTFGPIVDLSKGTNGGSWLPQLVATGSSAYVTWGSISGSGQFQLYFAYSHNNGSTFSSAVNLSNDSGNAQTALVDANGNLVVVLWLDTSIDVNGQPVAAYSTDGGQDFGQPIALNGEAGKYLQQENDNSEITHNGNMFFATWLDTASSTGKGEVFFNSGPVGDSPAGSQLSTSQTNVQPGSIVWLTGTGFEPNSQISFTFAGASFGSPFPTNSTGGFMAQVQIPVSTPTGTYNFIATDPIYGIGRTLENVTAPKNSVISATTADPYGTQMHVVGAVVTVTGTKFADNAPITVTFMGNDVANPTSNTTGGFVTQFTIPLASAGAYFIVGTDGTRSASLKYTLVPHLSTNSTKVKPGSMVTLSGNGYAANSQVSLTFNGSALGSPVTTNSTGGFVTVEQIPTSTPKGPYPIIGTDSMSNSASAKEIVG